MGLREAGLTGRNSTLSLMTESSSEDLARGGVVRAHVNIDRFEGFEIGRVHVPAGVARLSPDQRAHLVLHTIHRLTRALGQFRGWDSAVLDPVHARVLADGCAFSHTTEWKSNPGKSRQARAIFTLADDGFGRVVLEVSQPGGAVATVGPALGFTTPEGFVRSARTLRWRGKDAVELIPYSGHFGDAHGLLRWEAGGPGAAYPALTEADPAGTGRPASEIELGDVSARVVVELDGDTVPGKPPTIRSIGGGPTNGVPDGYLNTLHLLLEAVENPRWQRWWAASGDSALWIQYNLAPRTAGYRVRRGKTRVSGWIDRPASSVIAAGDPVDMAVQDVTALMSAAGARFGLDAIPPLPPRDALLDSSRTLITAWLAQQS
jgi:hypothetical protein